jgi:predicted TIM-barrel fold metal-dependent hydrolase
MIETPLISRPEQRILPEMASRLEEGNPRFDIHCHLFNREYIPDNYLHVRLPWLMKRHVFRRLKRILQGRRKDDDTWTQHASDFLQMANHETLMDIANELLQNSPDDFVYCPLMMDMTQAYGKTSIQDMDVQLDEMREVRNNHPDRMLPFVALDPNNPNMEALFRKAFSAEYNFYGVKIYPLLGYLPNHPRLMEVLEVCEALDIPVTSHCGGITTRALANRFELPFRRYDERGQKVDDIMKVSFATEAKKGAFFNDPARWVPVLERFPKLRLNLAHFGGDDAWKDYAKGRPYTWVHQIVSMMDAYENLYTDVSFLLHLTEKSHSGFQEALEELLEEKERVRNRTLFGTDFYMVLINEKLPQVIQNFLVRLDDSLVDKLTRENPWRFLNLNSGARIPQYLHRG